MFSNENDFCVTIGGWKTRCEIPANEEQVGIRVGISEIFHLVKNVRGLSLLLNALFVSSKIGFYKKTLNEDKNNTCKKILQLSRRFEFFKNTRSNQTDVFCTKHLAHLGWSAYRVNSLQKILNAENFSQKISNREIRIIFFSISKCVM